MPSFATTEDETAVQLVDVLDAYRSHHPDGDIELLRRAYDVAARAHRGQSRKTGAPYITHPLAVALMLAETGLDAPTVAAAFLHDTVEDTELTLEAIRQEFGDEIASLIDGVTKLDRVRYTNREQAQAATIRKMVVAMAQDVRVLLIKLFDRLHNIRTVGALREEKQVRVARETLDVYAPLAHRLGVQEIKHEFEDRCFTILFPGPQAEIEAKLALLAPEREAFIEKMVTEIGGILSDANIDATVTGRPKHHYSIYRKMMEQNRPFEEIHDLIGIRIVVDSTRDCYAALGLVHSHWVPVAGRFKDYIAMPKINLYQSLHTTVIGPDGKPLEIQIRTWEMHWRAEAGIAAHWRYKEGEHAPAASVDVEALMSDEDPEEFLANLKLDLHHDEVFVLTPGGDVKSLPEGATPVDFAYSVHTEVGHHCVGARINGRLVPLSTKLHSGDIVEVLTSKSMDAGPSRDWLKFARTGRAKSKIKQWFLRERRDQATTEGREQINTLFSKEAPELTASEREDVLGLIANELGHRDSDSLVIAVGEGNVSIDSVQTRMARILRPEPDVDTSLFKPRKRTTRSEAHVVVEGQDDMLVHLARCCSPVPGDDIMGYVTVGRGVSVHRSDCTNVASLAERRERSVDVSWPAEDVGAFVVWIQVEALDRTKLLRDVTTMITETGANITASSTVVGDDRVAILRYEVELSDPTQLGRLLSDMRGIDGVFTAFRLANDPASQ
ncbi:MAG: bifunctional (p)ppGpp synthetase/guanosine-3',5'-bis(diphosphate) 3'-pyrophosphohydrolase [Actinobacteria bacterium]|nr:MAG: bifunctional (p)ppGpp synthetase/guanosine-3',5'-bis(diphosphate) 3'-pyrophosphohydrolase [Actinomycetota bacterium]